MKQINVLGLISIDTLQFENYTSYLGGGAFATAWIASLWSVQAKLYSISCEKEYDAIINNNTSWNADSFSHVSLTKNKPMTRFEISQIDGDYSYKIFNMYDSKIELEQFLSETTIGQYIKLPAKNFWKLSDPICTASLNPQGGFDLFEFTSKLHTDGFIFLNKKELLTSSQLDLASTLKYIETKHQSFVITLGEEGAICYDAQSSKWCYSPSIQTLNYKSTLGCGDAFAGGFLAAKAKGYSVSDCMFYGTISAYLLTYSPSNMPTLWLDHNGGYEYLVWGLKDAIRYFETANDLVNFLLTQDAKNVTLNHSLNLSIEFDWKLHQA
ncbi:MAG TPA: carbohydrate kinase family protein [Lachnospiraceae bacterium]|nr:carbohydrate kinase family protein [Lachnospiraceae bacterium]